MMKGLRGLHRELDIAKGNESRSGGRWSERLKLVDELIQPLQFFLVESHLREFWSCNIIIINIVIINIVIIVDDIDVIVDIVAIITIITITVGIIIIELIIIVVVIAIALNTQFWIWGLAP